MQTLAGSVLGALIGLLGGPVGAGIGAGAGFVTGAVMDVSNSRISDDFVAVEFLKARAAAMKVNAPQKHVGPPA